MKDQGGTRDVPCQSVRVRATQKSVPKNLCAVPCHAEIHAEKCVPFLKESVRVLVSGLWNTASWTAVTQQAAHYILDCSSRFSDGQKLCVPAGECRICHRKLKNPYATAHRSCVIAKEEKAKGLTTATGVLTLLNQGCDSPRRSST